MSLVTVSDYVTFIRDRLREDTANAWTDAQLVRALQQGYFWQVEKLARSDPTRLYATTTISYVADQETYSLPENFWGLIAPPLRTDLDPDAPIAAVIYPDYWKYLASTSYQIFLNNEVYVFQGSKLRILPTPTDATRTLALTYARKPPALTSGTAAAGAASTMTLATAANATYGTTDPRDDYYNDADLYISSGTGVGERAQVTDYDGGTRVATVDFTSTPDNTSVYSLMPPWEEQHSYAMCYKAAAILLEDLGIQSNNDARAAEGIQDMIASDKRHSGPHFTRSHRPRL